MILSLRGARYRYAGASQPVLDGLDLDLEAGQVLGVVGPNDAGKSTLCLVAAGLAPGSIGGTLEGSVRLVGTETRELKPYEAAQRSGILFQNPQAQLSGTATTVFEEVAFGPRNLGLHLAEIVRRVEWALTTLGIGGLAARDPQRLSGGQAQLVALASVLVLRPRLLVLDEPTSELDPAGTRLVGDTLVRLAAATATAILIVEHKTSLLARFADEVAVLEAGRIVARGGARSILGSDELERRGVDPPAAVRLARAVADAGLGDRLGSIDLAALDSGALDPGALDLATSDRGDEAVAAAPPAGGPAVRVPDRPSTPLDDREDVRCEAVEFAFPDGTRALAGVDLSVRQGERVAIVGQNGSGKSTLVRHLNGLLRPSAGWVAIRGRKVGERHVADLAHEVGMAFQDPDRQLFAARVRDEVAFGPRNLGRARREVANAVAASLAAVGLQAVVDARPHDLGYSNRKLLALASVLAMGTPIVVLDEPTTGQDAAGMARVLALVELLARRGTTVITISHDVRFVAESAERVVVMGDGHVLLDASAGKAFSPSLWPILRSTSLEPPLAARVGAILGIGSTPTDHELVAALREHPRSATC